MAAGFCAMFKLISFGYVRSVIPLSPPDFRGYALSRFVRQTAEQVIEVFLCWLPDTVITGYRGWNLRPREAELDANRRHYRARQHGSGGSKAADRTQGHRPHLACWPQRIQCETGARGRNAAGRRPKARRSRLSYVNRAAGRRI